MKAILLVLIVVVGALAAIVYYAARDLADEIARELGDDDAR